MEKPNLDVTFFTESGREYHDTELNLSLSGDTAP